MWCENIISSLSGQNDGGDRGGDHLSDIDADLYFDQFEPLENEDIDTNVILINNATLSFP